MNWSTALLPVLLNFALIPSALSAGTDATTRTVPRIAEDAAVQSTRLVRKMPAIPVSAGGPESLWLRVVVGADGRVMEAAAPPDTEPQLARAAVATVRHWVYEPAVRDGYPVEVETEVNVPFQIVQPAKTPVSGDPLDREFAGIQNRYLSRRDFRRGFPALLKLAEQGHAISAAQVASLYFEGRGVTRDVDKALTWWRSAAERGDIGAQYALGSLYLFGNGGVQKNIEDGLRWLEAAGSQGHLQTLMLLGSLYSGQDGFPPDIRRAIHWYLMAARRGYVPAQRALGRAYLAAVPPEPDKAARYLKPAAQLGDREAMRNLARLYEDGDAGAVDRVAAYVWYRRADPNGFSPALRRLSAVMTEPELIEAHRRLAGTLVAR